MGRPKKELKRIHRKKTKRAKVRVTSHLKGDLPKEKLTTLAKKFLRAKKKKEARKTT